MCVHDGSKVIIVNMYSDLPVNQATVRRFTHVLIEYCDVL